MSALKAVKPTAPMTRMRSQIGRSTCASAITGRIIKGVSRATTPTQSYAATLQEIEKGVLCDIAHPADEGANLPDAGGLQSYDGVVLTGSALNIYDLAPAVTRQIELMRAVYASGTPAFGSCWGVQVGAVAAGGEVRKNPLGRE